jgi:hypothetical protein
VKNGSRKSRFVFFPASLTFANDPKESEGRCSFTCDAWTDPALQPFMAVTAHYIKESLGKKGPLWTLEGRLIAFKHIPGSHTGEALGKAFYDILVKCGLTRKVGWFTADNASNNKTMTEEVERVLKEEGIEFDANEQYIR